MAKAKRDDSKINGTGKGHIKFRYVDGDKYMDFDLEGVANEAVADGLKSIASALTGRTVISPGRALPKTAAAVVPTEALEEQGTTESLFPVSEEDSEVEDEDETVAEGVGSDRPKPRALKAPKFLSDLKLIDATVSLADFMNEKGAKEMMDKYAVVAVWLKEQFKLEEISIDHIYTAFKHLGWVAQLPTDVRKPLNNLCYSRNWFDRGKAKGMYPVNWQGEDGVAKMGASKP
jgi:hypothetical protein